MHLLLHDPTHPVHRRCSTSCDPSCAHQLCWATWFAQAVEFNSTLDEARVTVAMMRLDAIWDQLFSVEQSRIVRLLVEKVIVSPNDIELRLRAKGIERLVFEMRPMQVDATEEAVE